MKPSNFIRRLHQPNLVLSSWLALHQVWDIEPMIKSLQFLNRWTAPAQKYIIWRNKSDENYYHDARWQEHYQWSKMQVWQDKCSRNALGRATNFRLTARGLAACRLHRYASMVHVMREKSNLGETWVSIMPTFKGQATKMSREFCGKCLNLINAMQWK